MRLWAHLSMSKDDPGPSSFAEVAPYDAPSLGARRSRASSSAAEGDAPDVIGSKATREGVAVDAPGSPGGDGGRSSIGAKVTRERRRGRRAGEPGRRRRTLVPRLREVVLRGAVLGRHGSVSRSQLDSLRHPRRSDTLADEGPREAENHDARAARVTPAMCADPKISEPPRVPTTSPRLTSQAPRLVEFARLQSPALHSSLRGSRHTALAPGDTHQRTSPPKSLIASSFVRRKVRSQLSPPKLKAFHNHKMRVLGDNIQSVACRKFFSDPFSSLPNLSCRATIRRPARSFEDTIAFIEVGCGRASAAAPHSETHEHRVRSSRLSDALVWQAQRPRSVRRSSHARSPRRPARRASSVARR